MTKKGEIDLSKIEKVVFVTNRGRPKKDDAKKKSVIIPVRVTEEERDRLMEECEKAGKKTLSEYVRGKLLGP